METEEPFRIKAYYKADLALLYNPELPLPSPCASCATGFKKTKTFTVRCMKATRARMTTATPAVRWN